MRIHLQHCNQHRFDSSGNCSLLRTRMEDFTIDRRCALIPLRLSSYVRHFHAFLYDVGKLTAIQ